MKIKGVEENSKIGAIGSLFRRLDDSRWDIDIKLLPDQKKKYLGFSQMPMLTRHRILNPRENFRPAGFRLEVGIESTQTWEVTPIKSCPIPVVSQRKDSDQWCFVFKHDGIQVFLPQLELARALFFHHAYLSRLSLIPQGLMQEFDVQREGGIHAQINILPTCTLPLYARGDHALRRALAWILLDADARESFDSISKYQLQDGYDTPKYRRWTFRFDPPLLADVSLSVHGHYDRELKALFAYEIHGISNLAGDCPESVDFVDPRYREPAPGAKGTAPPGALQAPELDIDDNEDPTPENASIRIDTPMVAFEFANPIRTTRVGMGKGASGGIAENDETASQEKVELEVSTDEASTQGALPSADYDGMYDQSDDAHLYADKFEAFEQMVAQLVKQSHCSSMRREIRKLPMVEGCTKHLLPDGNPRCLAFHLVKRGRFVYALLEVDTSDDKNRISTLLLREQAGQDWNRLVAELEIRLVKRSLAWPSEFIKQRFGNAFKRIPHPQTSSVYKALLDQNSIQHWMERVYVGMSTI